MRKHPPLHKAGKGQWQDLTATLVEPTVAATLFKTLLKKEKIWTFYLTRCAL